ncbi:hypothetical protein ACHAPJ_006678 [Fusarium lateritium]
MGGGRFSSPTDAIDSVQFIPEEVRTMSGVAVINKTYVSCHAYTPASIQNAILNDTAKLMAEKDCLLTPTLVTYKAMASDQYVVYLPPEGVDKNEAVLHAGLRSLKIADEAGITMCYGTDLLGSMCHLQAQEFAIRSEVLGADKILRMATVNAARLLLRESELGVFQPGFAEDLLVSFKNPLEDIKVLDDPEEYLLLVMKEGRVHCSR